MANTEMFVSAAFLSILAIVAAFGFLITQLIIACFERYRIKKEARETENSDEICQQKSRRMHWCYVEQC